MQTTFPSRQNHFQNLLTLAIFMLIICYYAFNVPKSEKLVLTNSPEENKNVLLETSISKLRAAVLMDADMVEINGSLYATENALEDIVGSKKTKVAIRKIHEKLLLGDKQKAIGLINDLSTLVLIK